MESTNELVTKAEASAEGLSVDSTNECLTKAEFNVNLPTPLSSLLTTMIIIKQRQYIL